MVPVVRISCIGYGSPTYNQLVHEEGLRVDLSVSLLNNRKRRESANVWRKSCRLLAPKSGDTIYMSQFATPQKTVKLKRNMLSANYTSDVCKR